MRINPHVVRMVGNQVRFAIEARNPEAVIRIRRKQSDEGRGRMLRVADRNVQFIRSHDVQTWIAILPPKLMTDGDHFNCIARTGSLLDAADHSCRRHEQRHHDDHRNNRPCQFHLIAAVNLWRLATVLFLKRTTAYARRLKTTTNIVAVTASTKTDRPKIVLAGVDTGAKIFVGLSGGSAVPANEAVPSQQRTTIVLTVR